MGVASDGELSLLIDLRPVPKLRSLPFRLLSIACASLLAGLLIALEFAAFVFIANVVERVPLKGLVSFSVYAGGIGTAGFFVGLILLGSPLWLWLHGIGKRDYVTAGLAGGALASVVGFVAGAFSGWEAGLYMVAWVILPGLMAGLVMRCIAYEPRLRPPPAQPF